MKNILFYGLLVVMAFPCLAQEELTNVGIGDIVPPTTLHDISDHEHSTVDLAALSQRKVVIIDFWATWCSPCLAAMPHIDSLADRFKDELQVLTVTKEPQKHVRSFLRRRGEMGRYVSRSPKLFGDSALNSLFPHRTVPHYVWLKNGKVIAITESVVEDDLVNVLAGKQPRMRMKIDKKVERYNMHETSLFDFLYEGKLKYARPGMYSFSMPFIEELGTTGGYTIVPQDNGGHRITAVNMSLSQLYRVAFGKMTRFINGSAVDMLSDNRALTGAGLSGLAARDWIEKYSVCYEVSVSGDDPFEKMQEDLLHAFPQFEVSLRTVRDSCWVLEIIDEGLMDTWTISENERPSYNDRENCLEIRNGDLGGLLTYLEAFSLRNSQHPIINGTGYEGKVTLSICGDRNDIDAINVALREYGLHFVGKIHSYEKLVVRDRQKGER